MNTIKAIKNVTTNHTVVVVADEAQMRAVLLAEGVKFGKTSLSELLSGKRETVNGYTLVDLEEAPPANGGAPAGDNNGGADEGANAGDQNGGAADNGGGEQGNAEGGAGASEGGTAQGAAPGPAQGDEGAPAEPNAANAGAAPAANKPLTPEPGAAGAAPATRRKEIKNAEPKGKIKPVRKGTKIANGLAMLLKGTTVKDLEGADVSDDVFDFVNRRVTKRGYGVIVDNGNIKLKLPAGVTDVQYNAGGAADDDEPAKPAAAAPDAPADNKPADAPAADEKPADDAPAGDEKPADDKA